MEQETVSRLMKAEMEAKTQVDEAKKERDALLKQADEEALAMIEAERAKHAAELADAEQQQADGDSASQVAIEQSKADQIRAVTAKADQHKDSVMGYLVQCVATVNTEIR